uniref:Uncharacterized protein n=1 Tax=Anopheles merus TaxID=30066 RepID=A0A182V890_ANOME
MSARCSCSPVDPDGAAGVAGASSRSVLAGDGGACWLLPPVAVAAPVWFGACGARGTGRRKYSTAPHSIVMTLEEQLQLDEGQRYRDLRVDARVRGQIVAPLRQMNVLLHTEPLLVHVAEIEHRLRVVLLLGSHPVGGLSELKKLSPVVGGSHLVIDQCAHAVVVVVAELHLRRRVALGRGPAPVLQGAHQLLAAVLEQIHLLTVEQEAGIALRHLVPHLGQQRVLHERFFEPIRPVVLVAGHEPVGPLAPLGHVLEQLDCGRAGPYHAESDRVHLAEVVEREHVAGLGREAELPVDPALVGRLRKVLERFARVLPDALAVQVHDAEPALPDRVAQVGRLLEVLEGGLVVRLNVVAALEIDLAEERHCHRIARVRRLAEVLQRPLVVERYAPAALVVQLAEPDLRLHVALVRQQLVVVDQIVVEDARARPGVVHLVQQPDAVHGRPATERHLGRHLGRHLAVVVEGGFAAVRHAHARPVPVAERHLGPGVFAGRRERVVEQRLRLAHVEPDAGRVHEAEPHLRVRQPVRGQLEKGALGRLDVERDRIAEQLGPRDVAAGERVALAGRFHHQLVAEQAVHLRPVQHADRMLICCASTASSLGGPAVLPGPSPCAPASASCCCSISSISVTMFWIRRFCTSSMSYSTAGIFLLSFSLLKSVICTSLIVSRSSFSHGCCCCCSASPLRSSPPSPSIKPSAALRCWLVPDGTGLSTRSPVGGAAVGRALPSSPPALSSCWPGVAAFSGTLSTFVPSAPLATAVTTIALSKTGA